MSSLKNGVGREVRVAARKTEARDICAFELVDPSGEPLPAFTAGAHIDVQLEGGLVRQYSLCNDPQERHRYLIAVLRDPSSRGGSVAMHALKEGQLVRISDPKNHFELIPMAERTVLVAGGIGITPILSMAEQLTRLNASFELHYCARAQDRMAFVQRIRSSAFAGRSHFYFDDVSHEGRLDIGALTGTAQERPHLYVCGPTGFMDWVMDSARQAGLAEEHIHREYFSADPIITTGDGDFEVEVASTGVVVTVGAHQTVIAALALAGVEVETSCEAGLCGCCLTRVLHGVPDHRDKFLTAQEQARGDQFTPCCSRAKSKRLVLDL